jgi:hypothetical protein
MQRTIELSTKQKSFQMTRDSRSTSGIMVTIKEEDIMVEANIIAEEAITIKVSTKIIMEEDLYVGYAIKITISA